MGKRIAKRVMKWSHFETVSGTQVTAIKEQIKIFLSYQDMKA